MDDFMVTTTTHIQARWVLMGHSIVGPHEVETEEIRMLDYQEG
jgi:hypothetical protein